jgi:AcrR family transcriptional regulator
MGRIAGSSGLKTRDAISKAGLELIYEHGYEGTSLRQLAAVVGIQQGSLYNHFRSKQDLLVHLYEEHMGGLLDSLDAALDGLDGPSQRLRAFVAFHVGYHIERKREVFVVNSELRSLEPDNYRRATEMRKAYERRLIDILSAGAAEGVFSIADAPVTAYGILGMLSGICTWYDEGGRLDPATLIAIYSDLVLKSVGASEPLPRRHTRKQRTQPENTNG